MISRLFETIREKNCYCKLFSANCRVSIPVATRNRTVSAASDSK